MILYGRRGDHRCSNCDNPIRIHPDNWGKELTSDEICPYCQLAEAERDLTKKEWKFIHNVIYSTNFISEQHLEDMHKKYGIEPSKYNKNYADIRRLYDLLKSLNLNQYMIYSYWSICLTHGRERHKSYINKVLNKTRKTLWERLFKLL